MSPGTSPWKAAALTNSSDNQAFNAIPGSPEFTSWPALPQAASPKGPKLTHLPARG